MPKKIITLVLFEMIAFALIVTGVVPREAALLVAAGLALYALMAPLEDALVLFVASIPLFLALPITATFDNFNTWRILALIIFARWFLMRMKREGWPDWGTPAARKAPQSTAGVRRDRTPNTVIFALLLLLFLALASLIGSPDWKLGLKRIIYFGNISLVGIVAYDLLRRNKNLAPRIIRAIAIPTMIVIAVGFIQVISTYLVDIYQFMRIWGEGIQAREFGNTWSYIAVHLGNTWFAYYGEQLSLRVFSLFPDSHSFPQFVLLGIPALFALALDKLLNSPERTASLGRMIRTRTRLSIVWVPLALLIAILSGTRGIWAASIAAVLVSMGIIAWMSRHASAYHARVFKYLSLYLILFFMLFSIAYPVFVSPQFLVSKGNFLLLGERIRSIIDFGETSNAQRIVIWKQSIASIVRHPLLGVGIGNFPVILGQKLFLAKAGSSAHNIYLHIAAEMGIPALLIALWLLWRLFTKTYLNYVGTTDPTLMAYYGAALIYIPWVLAYCLTDVALFDERAFLLFVTTCALIAAHGK